MEDIKNLTLQEQESLYYSMGRDTALFGKVVMGHIVKEVPAFHKEIYSMMDDMTERKYRYSASVIFRGGAKSTISKTIKSCQDGCYAHEPVTMLISESIKQASMDLISIQDEFENNELIHGLYGNLKGSVWNQEECELANGVFYVSKGYGSRVRGFKWKTQRPTRFCIDDFESEHNTGTQYQRDAVVDWITAQVLPAGEPNTIFQFFGTIVHPEAWLAKVPDMKFFNKPMGKFIKVAVEENGKPSWPKRFPHRDINLLREFYKDQKKLAMFNQEYYHIPATFGEVAFNLDMIAEIDGTFGHYEHITWIEQNGVKHPCYVFIGVDPASSVSEKADNTVIFVMAMLPTGKIVILDVYADKIPPQQQIVKVFEYVRKYRPKQVTVETQGYQLALVSWLREKMNDGWQPAFPINEFKSNKSKNTKFLMGLEPIINYGECSRLKNCPGYEIFYKEASAFNGVSKEHDDTLDGFFLATQNVFKPYDFNVDKVIADYKHGNVRRRKRTYAAY